MRAWVQCDCGCKMWGYMEGYGRPNVGLFPCVMMENDKWWPVHSYWQKQTSIGFDDLDEAKAYALMLWGGS
jgi:hypothetical protein